jgi:hypothetical protein
VEFDFQNLDESEVMLRNMIMGNLVRQSINSTEDIENYEDILRRNSQTLKNIYDNI